MTSAPKALRIEQRLLVLARGMQEESFEGDREKICAVLIHGANTIIQLRNQARQARYGAVLTAPTPLLQNSWRGKFFT
jgi:hypothetical protein